MSDAFREVEVFVVGSGIAGCAAALGAARKGANVLVVTKAERPADATTDRAQGGIAVARGDPGQLKEDILTASDDTADPDAVDVLVSEADEVVRDVLLNEVGISFDETDEGPDYAREAAHSDERIIHVDASTGQHVLRPFLNYLDGLDRVEILEDTAVLELITHEGRVHGAVIDTEPTGEPIYAGSTILATGGIGACYHHSTNPDGATGDGIAMAALAGATVSDVEYVQFHPTACDPTDGEAFLVSEAVRGEGAVLRNGDGERFMSRYHDDAELAPRDVVSRAVARERERTGEVVLDVSPLDFEGTFPDLTAVCEDQGVELPEIPVAPSQHFLCGGIDVDHHGRTSLDRLYAVGECARTGVHGANRLASTSLLEGLVWGLRAGTDAVGNDVEQVDQPDLLDSDPALPATFARGKFARLQRVMDEHVGLQRTPDGLQRARAMLRRLKGEVDAYVRTRTSRELYELRNATVTALLVARAAAENPDSKGCHFVEQAGADRPESPPSASDRLMPNGGEH